MCLQRAASRVVRADAGFFDSTISGAFGAAQVVLHRGGTTDAMPETRGGTRQFVAGA
jgi:hypothetical protein